MEIASITRSYDAYLATRVRDYTSSYEEFYVYQQRANQIDNVIADASAGIDSMLQQFFASVNDVADDPTSIPARSVMINRANQLNDRFASLDGWFEDMRHQLNQDFGRQTNEINALARSLADVNGRVRTLSGSTGGVPNDILDERDRLIDELSRYTNVSTLEQDDGTMNVFVGTGQALVVGVTYNTLGVIDNPAGRGSQGAGHPAARRHGGQCHQTDDRRQSWWSGPVPRRGAGRIAECAGSGGIWVWPRFSMPSTGPAWTWMVISVVIFFPLPRPRFWPVQATVGPSASASMTSPT